MVEKEFLLLFIFCCSSNILRPLDFSFFVIIWTFCVSYAVYIYLEFVSDNIKMTIISLSSFISSFSVWSSYKNGAG